MWWTIKKAEYWRIQIVMLEKTFESPLDSKKIRPVKPKENQPWIFIRRTDAEADTPITLATWCKEPTHWKNLDAGKDWGQEEKGVTEDEMVQWHHHLKGHEFEQTLGDNEGQGSLMCCSSWGSKELDTTEWLWPLNDCETTRLLFLSLVISISLTASSKRSPSHTIYYIISFSSIIPQFFI